MESNMIAEVDLFGETAFRRYSVDVLPVSVVDLGKAVSSNRETGGHDEQSSRDAYSGFPCEIGTLCYQLYLKDCRLVFDPFAGWGERGRLAREHSIPYLGYDINPDAIAISKSRFEVENTLADSQNAYIPCFDGLLTCPPYWNLESYHPDGIDSCDSWEVFLDCYARVLGHCYDSAQTGAMFCIFVGDWRKDGIYYDLTFRTQQIMDELGATAFDMVIGSRSRITKIKVMLPQALEHGYTVKVHETLLVFRKQ
jgi:DNA modification methylase